MLLVSPRRRERFALVSQGAGVGRSQRWTRKGSGIRSLWTAEGFSGMKPQTSAFCFVHFLRSLWLVSRRGNLSRKHLGMGHEGTDSLALVPTWVWLFMGVKMTWVLDVAVSSRAMGRLRSTLIVWGTGLPS